MWWQKVNDLIIDPPPCVIFYIVMRFCVLLVFLFAVAGAQLDDYNRIIEESPTAYTDINGVVTKSNRAEFQCGNPSFGDSTTDYTLNVTHGLDGTVYEARVTCEAPQVVYDEVLVGWIPPQVVTYSGLVMRASASVLNGTWNYTTATPYTLNGTAKRLITAKRRMGTDSYDAGVHYRFTRDGDMHVPADLASSGDLFVSPYAGKMNSYASLADARRILSAHQTQHHSSSHHHEFVFIPEHEGIIHAQSGDVLTRASVNNARFINHMIRTKAQQDRWYPPLQKNIGAWGDAFPRSIRVNSHKVCTDTPADCAAAAAYLACLTKYVLDDFSMQYYCHAPRMPGRDTSTAVAQWMRVNNLTIEAFKQIDAAVARIVKVEEDQANLDAESQARSEQALAALATVRAEAGRNSDGLATLKQWVSEEGKRVAANFTVMKATLESEITTGLGEEFAWTVGEIRHLRNNVSAQFSVTADQVNAALLEVQTQVHRVDARIHDQQLLFGRYVQSAEVDRSRISMTQNIALAYHLMIEDAKANDMVPWLIDEGIKPWHDPSVFEPSRAVITVDEMTWVYPADLDPTTGSQGAQCTTLHTGYAGDSYDCATGVEYKYSLKCNAEFMDRFSHADLPWSFLVENLNSDSCNTTFPSEVEFLDTTMPCKCWVEKQLISTCQTDFWPITSAAMHNSPTTPGRLSADSDYCQTVGWEYVHLGSGDLFTASTVNDHSTDSAYLTTFTNWASFQEELVSMCGITPSIQFATASHLGASKWTVALAVNVGHIVGLSTAPADTKMHFSSIRHNMFHEVVYNVNDTCVLDDASIALQHMLEPNAQSIWLFVTPISWNGAYRRDLKEYSNRRYGTLGIGTHIETYSASALGHEVQEVNRISFVATPKNAKMVPVYMLVPREVEKLAKFTVLSPTDTGISDARVPAIFESDFSFLAPGQIMRVGYKECSGIDTTDPKCDYIERNGNEGYTFDPPQELLSTGDLPGLFRMMAPASWPNETMYPMQEWHAAHNNSRFNPADASFSLSDFYTPMTSDTRLCNKPDGSIQVNGFWCSQLDKMYWRRHDDGDCTGESDTCLVFRNWRMRAQFIVPFGQFETTRIYGCPVVEVIPQTTGHIQVGLRNVDYQNNTEFISYTVTKDDVAVIGPIHTNIPFGETLFFDIEGTALGGAYALNVSSGGRLCRNSNMTFAQQHADVAHQAATTQVRVEVAVAETGTQFLSTENGAAVVRFALSLYYSANITRVAEGLTPLPPVGDELKRIIDDMKSAGANANFTHFNTTAFADKIDRDIAAAAADAAHADSLIDEIQHLDVTLRHDIDGLRDDTSAANASQVLLHLRLVQVEAALAILNTVLQNTKSADDCGMMDMCTWKPILMMMGIVVGVLIAVITTVCCIPKCRHRISGHSAPKDPMLEMMRQQGGFDSSLPTGDDFEDDPELAALADAQDADIGDGAPVDSVPVDTTPDDAAVTTETQPSGVLPTTDTPAAASLPAVDGGVPDVAGPLRRNLRLNLGFHG